MGEQSTISCYWCSSPVEMGVRVCRGCNADVVYAATRREQVAAFKWGILLGAVLAAAVMLRMGVNGNTSADTGSAIIFGIPFGCAVALVVIRRWMLKGKVRFFRRGERAGPPAGEAPCGRVHGEGVERPALERTNL